MVGKEEKEDKGKFVHKQDDLVVNRFHMKQRRQVTETEGGAQGGGGAFFQSSAPFCQNNRASGDSKLVLIEAGA